ncbi:DNA polymerase I [Moheibacter lacus]|uniref:DNA polymerase I n=1 Tax=Moheibacter lacus TaxID=2745851 RepID=A0A838ZPF2_9FLAO|nr:DNA polymerase I [Moheibacter lacus]MBA5629307.1 DNA polymerase I [Moheibacter lacus]
MNTEDKRLFLLDAYALIFRGYYAFIKNPRINSKGLNTSAILGFTNSLLDVIKREKPTHIAVVFDVGQATVRTVDYDQYKANRDETPEAIKIAVPYIQEIIRAMCIPVLFAEGYEADDVIGTLAKKAEKEGYTTYMVTPDKDFAQLVSDKIKMYRPPAFGKGIEIWGVEEVKEKFGVQDPIQVIDFLGMMGDSVDNIPGLPGVGEKTAKKFLAEYGSLENLLENTDKLKGKMKENIEANKELGILSKKLATIIIDAPVDFDEEDLTMCAPDVDKVKEIFNELEFRQLLENFYRTFNLESDVVEKTKSVSESAVQQSLFGGGDADSGEIPSTAFFTEIDTYDHLYQLTEGKMGRKLLIDKLLQQKEVCFDTETTGLDALTAELVGISFSFEAGKGYYVPFPQDFNEAKAIIEEFRPFFESESVLKIGHNLKYDYKVLFKYGIVPKGKFFDTMIAHYLLNPDMRHGMDVLSETYLNYKPISIETLIGKKGKNQKQFNEVDLEQQKEYAVEDADVTFQLKTFFAPQLPEVNAEKLFHEIEMPLMEVLSDMEIEGIRLDTEVLAEQSVKITAEILELEKKIFEKAGEAFNLNSPKQLGDILFEKLELDKKAKKTKTGQYATGEEVLTKLVDKHPIISDILDYRQLQKLKSTYVDALPKEVSSETQRIHTTFSQTVAATGRLASVGPNLQNIPIRSEQGREIRKAFVARDENYVLVSADYSQIELRIIAELSQDPIMMEAFQKGEDIHRTTAAKVFKVALDEVTREQRSQAKTVNFGIVYGVSAFGLSEQTGLSRAESKQLIDAYYETYPTLKKFMEEQIHQAREKGYVETILGRRRYLKDINSRNHVVRSFAERIAVNAPIQGSAADIIKIAMINLQKVLKENYQTKMLLQVHDELVFDVPKSELETIKPIIKETMENAVKMQVPLEVEIGVGQNWLEAH